MNLLNPSKDARTTSPGRRLKNFWPALEFTNEPVKKSDTSTTPERIPDITFSDIIVIFLTLNFKPVTITTKYKEVSSKQEYAYNNDW